MRLDKFLAQSAVGKRKEVRLYVKEGKVKVNNIIVKEPSMEIDENLDNVQYLCETIEYVKQVYYMFNKPKGCITATRDNIHKTVFDFLNEEDTKGIFHVGRLDKDTEGLLLLTNDGEFEHNLMDPKKHVFKTYFFWAIGSLDYQDINNLQDGVKIIQGTVLTKPAEIEVCHCGKYEEFKNDIDRLCNKELNIYNQPVVSGYLTISEGCKHQVKRMLKAVGCYIVYLKRISIGNIKLDQSLKKGEYRLLTETEVQTLLSNNKKDHK